MKRSGDSDTFAVISTRRARISGSILAFILVRAAFPLPVFPELQIPNWLSAVSVFTGLVILWRSVLSAASIKEACLLSVLYAFLAGATDCSWLGVGYFRFAKDHRYFAFVIPIFLGVAYALYGGIWGALTARCAKKDHSATRAAFFSAALWTACTTFRAERLPLRYTNWFTGIPLGELGYAKFWGTIADRLVPILGVHSLTFLLVLLAALCAFNLPACSKKVGATVLLSASILLVLLSQRWAAPNLNSAPIFKATIIQSNLPADRVMTESRYELAAYSLFSIARESAFNEQADLIITPETFWPAFLDLSKPAPIKKENIPQLIGAISLSPDADAQAAIRRNSAVLMQGDKILGAYHKTFLVPLLELPPNKTLPLIEYLVPDFKFNIVAGDVNQRRLQLKPGQHMAVKICFDDLFGPSIFQDPLEPVSFMASLGSLETTANTPGTRMQLLYSLMRARELGGVPLLRAANYGISGYGTPAAFEAFKLNEDIVRTVSVRLPRDEKSTFYMRWHRMLDLLWIVLPLLVMALARINAKKRPSTAA